jgi:predicted transcriptional regulator
VDQLYSVSPDTELEDALRMMDENNVAQVPVMLDGRVMGMIGRDHLIRLILNRMALTKS